MFRLHHFPSPHPLFKTVANNITRSNALCIFALGGTLYLSLAVGQVGSGSHISVIEVRRVAVLEAAAMRVVVSSVNFLN